MRRNDILGCTGYADCSTRPSMHIHQTRDVACSGNAVGNMPTATDFTGSTCTGYVGPQL